MFYVLCVQHRYCTISFSLSHQEKGGGKRLFLFGLNKTGLSRKQTYVIQLYTAQYIKPPFLLDLYELHYVKSVFTVSGFKCLYSNSLDHRKLGPSNLYDLDDILNTNFSTQILKDTEM